MEGREIGSEEKREEGRGKKRNKVSCKQCDQSGMCVCVGGGGDLTVHP